MQKILRKISEDAIQQRIVPEGEELTAELAAQGMITAERAKTQKEALTTSFNHIFHLPDNEFVKKFPRNVQAKFIKQHYGPITKAH